MQFLNGSLLLACCASVLCAQAYIVDAANGPGTHFTEIATAVAVVPDGAVLDVRAGSYMAFGIANKGLSIRCASGVTVSQSGAVTVTGTASHQTVELRGLDKPQGDLDVISCQGLVLLHGCNVGTSSGGTLHVSTCTNVLADACAFGNSTQYPAAGVRLQGSYSVFSNCMVMSSAAAVDIRSSSAQLVDCTVLSVAPSWWSPISLSWAGVRIVGGSVITTASLVPVLSGVGTARVDPGVIHGQPSWSQASVQCSVVAMPSLVTAGGALGANVTATMRGPTGYLGALFVGLPGVPWLYSGTGDPIWLQPGTEAVCAFTVFAAGVPLAVTYQVPNAPAMRGMRFAWQGGTLGGWLGTLTSNPAVTTHF